METRRRGNEDRRQSPHPLPTSPLAGAPFSKIKAGKDAAIPSSELSPTAGVPHSTEPGVAIALLQLYSPRQFTQRAAVFPAETPLLCIGWWHRQYRLGTVVRHSAPSDHGAVRKLTEVLPIVPLVGSGMVQLRTLSVHLLGVASYTRPRGLRIALR